MRDIARLTVAPNWMWRGSEQPVFTVDYIRYKCALVFKFDIQRTVHRDIFL
jgi:hypothetical protein